jgi:hypothetical protein
MYVGTWHKTRALLWLWQRNKFYMEHFCGTVHNIHLTKYCKLSSWLYAVYLSVVPEALTVDNKFSANSKYGVGQGCTISGHQVARDTKFFTVTPNICVSSGCNLLHVIFLVFILMWKVWNIPYLHSALNTQTVDKPRHLTTLNTH